MWASVGVVIVSEEWCCYSRLLGEQSLVPITLGCTFAAGSTWTSFMCIYIVVDIG